MHEEVKEEFHSVDGSKKNILILYVALAGLVALGLVCYGAYKGVMWLKADKVVPAVTTVTETVEDTDYE